jgi:hypothetical protein
MGSSLGGFYDVTGRTSGRDSFIDFDAGSTLRSASCQSHRYRQEWQQRGAAPVKAETGA